MSPAIGSGRVRRRDDGCSCTNVLVAGDTELEGNALSHVIAGSRALRLAGVARDATEVLRAVEVLDPELVTLDLEMPGLSGLEVLRRLRERGLRRPRVVVLSACSADGARRTIEALALGAADCVLKPTTRAGARSIAERLVPRLEALARFPAPAVPSGRPGAPVPVVDPIRAIAIASSLGGLPALEAALRALPGDFPVPILVVQHLPATFTAVMAEHLGRRLRLRVVEAVDGMRLAPGTVHIAQGDRHLALALDGGSIVARAVDDEPVNGSRPSADVLFRFCAALFGRHVLAAVFTGPGRDGADGIRALTALGAPVITQTAESCAADGMPQAVDALGAANGHFVPESFADSLAGYRFAW